jgi:hypothetical protein
MKLGLLADRPLSAVRPSRVGGRGSRRSRVPPSRAALPLAPGDANDATAFDLGDPDVKVARRFASSTPECSEFLRFGVCERRCGTTLTFSSRS